MRQFIQCCNPLSWIEGVAENTKNLKVFCTYMDTLRPGQGCADILPECVKDAGSIGIMINHPECNHRSCGR